MPHDGKHKLEHEPSSPESRHLELGSFDQNPELPSLAELRQQLDDLTDDYIYQDGSFIHNRLLKRAVVGAALAIQGDESRTEQVAQDTLSAQREHERSFNQIRPHFDWKNASLINILVDDYTLPRRQFHSVNHETHEITWHDESDAALESRRSMRERSFRYAFDFTHREVLLAGLGDPSRLRETINKELADTHRASTDERLVLDAQALFNQAHSGNIDQDSKQQLLGASLDKSIAVIENFSETDSPEKAHAYLVAGQSIHDLAKTPGSFEKHMSEAEAHEFRVRALEMASEWVDKAAATYQKVFDNPIGRITKDRFDHIRLELQQFMSHIDSLKNARWFKNIYQDDYKEAAAAMDRLSIKRRSIGEKAVIFFLDPALSPNALLPLPLNANTAQQAG